MFQFCGTQRGTLRRRSLSSGQGGTGQSAVERGNTVQGF
jgi:hypothetical protein